MSEERGTRATLHAVLALEQRAEDRSSVREAIDEHQGQRQARDQVQARGGQLQPPPQLGEAFLAAIEVHQGPPQARVGLGALRLSLDALAGDLEGLVDPVDVEVRVYDCLDGERV